MPGSIVVNVAMSWQYWNTVNLLTATLLLFWLMRSLRNLYRAFKVRGALITGRLVQVRGLGSYLHYLEGATPAHASHVMHTRQVEPPTGVQSLYSPTTVGSVSVSVVDADKAYNRKLRYHVELSTSVPCKVMVLTDFFPSTFKRKVDDPGFGNGAAVASGRSRSNSRSNLRGTSAGGRSRSNSRSSVAGDAWIETLETENLAAGGVGMGVHGLFERSKVCYSSSKFTDVEPGVHSLELDTLMLNLDRYVAPQVVPPAPPSPGPSKVRSEAAGAGEGDVALMEEGKPKPEPGPDQQVPLKQFAPPSEVLFGLLIVPEGPMDVDVRIGDAEASYELSKDDADALGATTAPATTTSDGGDKAGTVASDSAAGAGNEATGSAPGGGRRRVQDRPFLNLLRGLVGVHVPHEDTGGAFPYFAEDPQNLPPGVNASAGRVGSGAEAGGLTIAASDGGLSGGKLSEIRERKKLLTGTALDPSFSMLVMGASVRTLMEVTQNSRYEQSATAPANSKGEGEASKSPKSRVELSTKEYLLGANGICYTNLEIFGLQSELSTTTFMEMTVLNQEKEDGTTKIKFNGGKSEDSGGFEDDCVICMCEEKQVMLLPCRHFCVCPNCLVKIDKCPVCRAAFEEYVVITKGDKTASQMTVPFVGGARKRNRSVALK